jgi:hypothetical protein
MMSRNLFVEISFYFEMYIFFLAGRPAGVSNFFMKTKWKKNWKKMEKNGKK